MQRLRLSNVKVHVPQGGLTCEALALQTRTC